MRKNTNSFYPRICTLMSDISCGVFWKSSFFLEKSKQVKLFTIDCKKKQGDLFFKTETNDSMRLLLME